MRTGRKGGVAKALLVIGVIAVICGIAIGIYFDKVMVVKTLTVQGVDDAAKQDVARMSGIRLGQSIYDVDSRQVAINLREDGYIKLVDLEVIKPDTVVLTAARRQKVAALEHLGFLYVVDREMSVLECLSGMSDAGVLRITGAQIQQTPVGMAVNMEENVRDTAAQVLSAIEDAGLGDEIAELNVASVHDLYVVTRSRYVFRLGTAQRLAEKLAWVRPMVEQLTGEGRTSGTVDVSGVSAADYMPPRATPAPTLKLSPQVTFAPFDMP